MKSHQTKPDFHGKGMVIGPRQIWYDGGAHASENGQVGIFLAFVLRANAESKLRPARSSCSANS